MDESPPEEWGDLTEDERAALLELAAENAGEAEETDTGLTRRNAIRVGGVGLLGALGIAGAYSLRDTSPRDNLESHNPVIAAPDYSETRLRAPHVVANGSGGYKMHYEATAPDGTNGIYEADSDDGVNWTTPMTQLLAPAQDYDWIGMPTVVQFDGQWYLYYGRRKSSSANFEIAAAISSSLDGTWTKQGTVLTAGEADWEAEQVRGPDVINEDGTLKMYYMGHETGGSAAQWAIGLATSTDGTTFTRESSNPVVDGVPDTYYNTDVANPGVLKHDGTYYLFFEGLEDDSQPAKIGMVKSDDGITWEYPGNDVAVAPTGGWRAYSVYDAAPVEIGGDILVYFTGADQRGGTQQIGATQVDL